MPIIIHRACIQKWVLLHQDGETQEYPHIAYNIRNVHPKNYMYIHVSLRWILLYTITYEMRSFVLMNVYTNQFHSPRRVEIPCFIQTGISREGPGCGSIHAKLTQKRRKTFSHHTSAYILTRMVVDGWWSAATACLIFWGTVAERGIQWVCELNIPTHTISAGSVYIICGRKIWKSELTAHWHYGKHVRIARYEL